jgi:hypothetical protein
VPKSRRIEDATQDTARKVTDERAQARMTEQTQKTSEQHRHETQQRDMMTAEQRQCHANFVEDLSPPVNQKDAEAAARIIRLEREAGVAPELGAIRTRLANEKLEQQALANNSPSREASEPTRQQSNFAPDVARELNPDARRWQIRNAILRRHEGTAEQRAEQHDRSHLRPAADDGEQTSQRQDRESKTAAQQETMRQLGTDAPAENIHANATPEQRREQIRRELLHRHDGTPEQRAEMREQTLGKSLGKGFSR